MMDPDKKLKGQIKDIYEDIRLSPEKKETAYEAIIKRAEREDTETGKGKKEDSMKRLLKAAVVAGCILVGGGSVYAAVHLLHPSEVAKEMEQPKLADQFSGLSEHVETQENDTYRVSYLGEVSGKNLTEQTKEDVDKEKTYYVLAVEKKGGEKITYDDKVVATPFIKGIAPWTFNIFTMGGGSESTIRDNVRYYIFEVGNMEIFADRGVYLGVCESAPGSEEYSFDEKTGEIARKKNFKGLNMLFELDMDKSKADPEKAEAYLKELGLEHPEDYDGTFTFSVGKEDEGQKENYNGTLYKDSEEGDPYQWNNYFLGLPNHLKKAFIKHCAALVPDSVKTIKENEDGMFVYSWKEDGEEHTTEEAKRCFQTGEINMSTGQLNDGSLFLVTTVLNEDETLTVSRYRLDEKKLKSYEITRTKRVTEEYLNFGKYSGDWLMEIIKGGILLPDSVKTVAANAQGKYEYSFELDKDCYRKVAYAKEFFTDFEPGEEFMEGAAGDDNRKDGGYVVTTYKLNEDGTVTFQAYEFMDHFFETVK